MLRVFGVFTAFVVFLTHLWDSDPGDESFNYSLIKNPEDIGHAASQRERGPIRVEDKTPACY